MHKHLLLLFVLTQGIFPADSEQLKLHFYATKKPLSVKKANSPEEFFFMLHAIKESTSHWQDVPRESWWSYGTSFVVNQGTPDPITITFANYFTILGTMSYSRQTTSGSYSISRTELNGTFDKDEIRHCMLSSVDFCKEYLARYPEQSAESDDTAFLKDIIKMNPELKKDFNTKQTTYHFKLGNREH